MMRKKIAALMCATAMFLSMPGTAYAEVSTVTGSVEFTAENKLDSNGTADLNAAVGAMQPGDEIIITGLTGEFDSADAGVDKTVNVDITGATITGNNSEHYTVSYSSTTVKATIHKAVAKITAPPVAAAPTYNGNEQDLIATGAVVNTTGV